MISMVWRPPTAEYSTSRSASTVSGILGPLGCAGNTQQDVRKTIEKRRSIEGDYTRSGARESKSRQRLDQRTHVRRHFGVDGDVLARARMCELQMRGMQRNASDPPLGSFVRMVFAVAHHRMPDGRK